MNAKLAAFLVKKALDVYNARPWFLRPVSAILGRLQDPIYFIDPRLMFRRTAHVKHPAVREFIEYMRPRPETEDVALSLGSIRPWLMFKRIMENPTLTRTGKLITLLGRVPAYMTATLSRGDFYDPVANTAVVYHASEPVLAHELGHAIDFNYLRGRWIIDTPYVSTVAPSEIVSREFLASLLAAYFVRKMLRERRERGELTKEDEARLADLDRILRRAFATYLGLGSIELPKKNVFLPNLPLAERIFEEEEATRKRESEQREKEEKEKENQR